MTAASPETVDPGLTLAFFKLVVKDVDAIAAFYQAAFGFGERNRLDLPNVEEAMLTLPGQVFNLVLCRWKDGREIMLGNGYGPVGLVTRDVDAAFARAIANGGTSAREPFVVGKNRIAFVLDPEGHEIELIQFNAA
jgi:lactoylglutathione lyase